MYGLLRVGGFFTIWGREKPPIWKNFRISGSSCLFFKNAKVGNFCLVVTFLSFRRNRSVFDRQMDD